MKAPELPIVAPGGAPGSREKVRVLIGMSVSVAVAVNVIGMPIVLDLFPMVVNTGAAFTSPTVTWMVSKSLNAGDPLSVTPTVMGYCPGPCASVGVQAKAPDAPFIDAPVAAGLPSVRENVRVCPASASVAVAVKVNAVCSLTVLFPMVARTGALPQLEQTVIWIGSKSLRGGDPLSVTRTATGKVPVEAGVQLNAPVEAPIVAPAGAPASSENASAFAGTSASVAVAVNETGTPTGVPLYPIAARTGGTLASLTPTWMDSKS